MSTHGFQQLKARTFACILFHLCFVFQGNLGTFRSWRNIELGCRRVFLERNNRSRHKCKHRASYANKQVMQALFPSPFTAPILSERNSRSALRKKLDHSVPKERSCVILCFDSDPKVPKERSCVLICFELDVPVQ